MRARLRSLFPPHGSAYELLDTSALLFCLGFIGYIVTDPPPTTQATLPPLRLVTDVQLGMILTVAAVIGILCAYVPALRRCGYVVVITAALIMCLNFTVGSIESQALRPMVSAILYGWIARRLIRDNSEAA